jgi:hypothetical protein
MKYFIVEHSSGKYFGFNLCESNELTSAISIVQDKDEFMVMGWKVAKVIPTWVLGFVDWNNLMMSYNATLSQGIEMVNTTNDVFNANNVNVGNNDEVHDHESKQRVVGMQENPPSNITKLQNMQRRRTNIGISSNKIFTITCAKYSNIEFLCRKHNACTVGTPENPKTRRIYVGIRTNISSQPAQI